MLTGKYSGSLRLPRRVADARKGAATKRRASGLKGKARLSSDRGALDFSNTITRASHVSPSQSRQTKYQHTSTRDGARPSAASAMAQPAARPQWLRPACLEPPVPAATGATVPCTTYAICCTRNTVHITSLISVAGRVMGWHIEGSTKEEDVISQEATTVHGWQGLEGHHSAYHVSGVRAGQADAFTVSVLC